MNDPAWGTSRIGFLVFCDSVAFNQVDPIAAFGVDSSAHLHEFFGNPAVTSRSTTQSLIDVPSSGVSCTDKNDKSAYWTPAVYQGNVRATAVHFSAYYKNPTGLEVAMPLGLRMIAGNAHATQPQSSKVGWWETFQMGTTSAATGAMIQRQNGDPISLRINYPQCWDGVHLDSPDHQSHMAYARNSPTSGRANGCPASHPVRLPQLTTFAFYDIDGGDGLSLSSGEWFTFHQDFWNGWEPDHMDRLIDECGRVQRMMCRPSPTPALGLLGQHAIMVA